MGYFIGERSFRVHGSVRGARSLLRVQNAILFKERWLLVLPIPPSSSPQKTRTLFPVDNTYSSPGPSSALVSQFWFINRVFNEVIFLNRRIKSPTSQHQNPDPDPPQNQSHYKFPKMQKRKNTPTKQQRPPSSKPQSPPHSSPSHRARSRPCAVPVAAAASGCSAPRRRISRAC